MSQRPLPVLFVCLLKQGQAESEASVDFLAGRSPVNLGAQASGLCSEKAPFVGPSLPSQVQGLDSSGETPSVSKSPWAAPLMARSVGVQDAPVKRHGGWSWGREKIVL